MTELVYESHWVVSQILPQQNYSSHASKDDAIKLAKNLAKQYPGRQFGVFEMITVFSAPVEVFEYRVKDTWDDLNSKNPP